MKLRSILLNLAVAFIALVVLFPLVWMVSVSFMAPGEAAVFPPPLWPKTWTLEHYCDLFLNQGMGRYLWNSFALATLATILALGFTVPAGYAFAKLRFRGRERLFQFLVAALVVPAQIGTLTAGRSATAIRSASWECTPTAPTGPSPSGPSSPKRARLR